MFKKSIVSLFNKNNSVRSISTKIKEMFEADYKTNAWQMHSYGGINEIQLTSTRVPIIENPRDVLVKVAAASINPIDLYMAEGYGKNLLQVQRGFKNELPLTLGRDFSGTVLEKGLSVSENIKIGDSVYGFVPLERQGTWGEITLTEEGFLAHKPSNLTNAESASLVYTIMTAWSALFLSGGLAFVQDKTKVKTLVLGASGGVGTMAVQLLKSQGCEVVATSSTDAIPLVTSLGADKVFDYRDKKHWNQIANEGPYQIILDFAKIGHGKIPLSVKFNTYVTLDPPLANNTDKYGVVGGLILSGIDLVRSNVMNIGKFIKWGFFLPSKEGFQFVDGLIKEGKIRPVIHKEFKFSELPEAIKEVQKGHLRGKVVVTM